jgi:hypothetical protein
MTPSSPVSPSLEVHIPISPTVPFLRMVRCLVTSLRHFGGLYADAKVVVTIGDPVIKDKELLAENPWLEKLGIETRWVPEDLYARESYYATASERFCYEYSSDMVLMLDADMLVARPFEELVGRLHLEQKFGAVIAYASPYTDSAKWQTLYDACGLGKADAIYEHPGWPYLYPERDRFCPPYFNLGFLLMPASMATQIGREIYTFMNKAVEVEDTIYKCQLAVGLAVHKLQLPFDCLPLRYNFANSRDLEALHGGEQALASILHIIWDNQKAGKGRIYGEEGGLEAMVKREDLGGINKQVQSVLRQIWFDL